MAGRTIGKIDLLGLNSFGNPTGLNPIWGTVIGGGVAGATTIISRHSGNAKLMDYAEGVGLAAGLATSGVMYAMKSTRHAAIGSAVGAFLAAGIAWLEKTLLGAAVVNGAAAVPAVTAEQVIKGLGIPGIRPLNGFGIPQARELNGFGVPMISERHPPAGAIPGVAGNQLNGVPGLSQPPVSLLGPMSVQAASLRAQGGPLVHGLSAAYGATLLGGGR